MARPEATSFDFYGIIGQDVTEQPLQFYDLVRPEKVVVTRFIKSPFIFFVVDLGQPARIFSRSRNIAGS